MFYLLCQTCGKGLKNHGVEVFKGNVLVEESKTCPGIVDFDNDGIMNGAKIRVVLFDKASGVDSFYA